MAYGYRWTKDNSGDHNDCNILKII